MDIQYSHQLKSVISIYNYPMPHLAEIFPCKIIMAVATISNV